MFPVLSFLYSILPACRQNQLDKGLENNNISSTHENCIRKGLGSISYQVFQHDTGKSTVRTGIVLMTFSASRVRVCRASDKLCMKAMDLKFCYNLADLAGDCA